MTKPLISIGGAQLVTRGLYPQRIGTMSEVRVPGVATWTGMDFQPTGLGEAHTRLEAITFRQLSLDESHLHPFDGVGRRVGVEIDLVMVGGT